MNSPQETIDYLTKEDSFLRWKKQHPKAFLSHFFCPITAELELQGTWEIGFYDPVSDKMEVFVVSQDTITQRPEDDVFKKPDESVEALNLQTVVLPYTEARRIARQQFAELFSQEQRNEGFLVLQTLEKKPLWNFTLMTKSLKFVNIKLHAKDGVVVSHQAIELVQK